MQDSPEAVARARWAVAFIFLANGTIIGTWAAHIPLVEARLGISHTALGFALLAMALGALIAMPLGGAAIGRFGSAAVTRVVTIVWLCAFPLPILAPNFALLICGLLFFGATNGVLDVAMNAHGVAVEHRYGRPVMSSFHGMWSLGGLDRGRSRGGLAAGHARDRPGAAFCRRDGDGRRRAAHPVAPLSYGRRRGRTRFRAAKQGAPSGSGSSVSCA